MGSYGFNIHRWKDFIAASAIVVLPMLFIIGQKREVLHWFICHSSLCSIVRECREVCCLPGLVNDCLFRALNKI